jgi:hypothetical protein
MVLRMHGWMDDHCTSFDRVWGIMGRICSVPVSHRVREDIVYSHSELSLLSKLSASSK